MCILYLQYKNDAKHISTQERAKTLQKLPSNLRTATPCDTARQPSRTSIGKRPLPLRPSSHGQEGDVAGDQEGEDDGGKRPLSLAAEGAASIAWAKSCPSPRLDSAGRVTALTVTRGSLARAGTTQVFTEGAVFYNLKELVRAPVRASSAFAPPSCHLRSLAVVQEAICSKQKGIVLQSVKDVLTDLLSDDMVTQDKVGTQTL